MALRFALMTEPQQGLTYDNVLAICQTAEEVGFESYFRSDHYASFPGAAGKPTTDAWATLAGLARETKRITLGTLVSPIAFRPPGNLAKVAATVAEMSGGRIELGLGAGWNELEHDQYAFDFPPTRERFDMLEEQLAIVHGLWTEPDGWSYQGQHWQVKNAMFRSRPLAPAGLKHPNLIVGGGGGPRMAALAARYADEENISSASAARVAEAYKRLDAACRDVGRDPATVTRSAMTGVLVGRSADEVRARVAELIRTIGGDRSDPDDWLADRRERWILGTPDEARARAREFEEAGVQRVMLQTFLPHDLEMVRLLGEIFLG